MTTERDIEGYVLALVGSFVEGQKTNDAMMRERDEGKRAELKKANESHQQIALDSAVKLVTTFLCDVHRIADSLEATTVELFPDPVSKL